MINKMILQGRLTADVEVKRTANGDIPYAEFTIAWSEKYKDERRLFLRCKAWRSTAEFLGKYFFKGKEIIIEGSMVTEEWEKDGDKKNRTICLVDKVNFCGGKGGTDTGEQQQQESRGSIEPAVTIPEGFEMSDELPFN